jgi:hypothetical protein
MLESNQKISLLVPNQLPEFIRDNPDYSKFVAFVQAYYEWLEETGNVLERGAKIPDYTNIDKTSQEFLNYYVNDFLPYFPEDALVSKQDAIKFAKELYSSKGTPGSYQFLFRVLYDSDFDVFYTKDAVLRASDGIWYVSQSLKLSTSDPRFLKIKNYRLFGERTKSIATIENSLFSGTKIEVFISNIQRLFQSGETVRVVDNDNQDILIDGLPLRADVVGQISQIRVNPRARGLLYDVGDPVIIFGGLNEANGKGALAEVGSITSGAIQRVNVIDGGYGYSLFSNTIIDITNAPGAEVRVASVNPDPNTVSQLILVPENTISLKRFIRLDANNYNFPAFANANINTTLSDAFTFNEYLLYPISSIVVVNGGGGITQIPTLTPRSTYKSDLSQSAGNIKDLGVLAPIEIISGGVGYEANDTIVFTGGIGYGAYANVATVNATGSIRTVRYVYNPETNPLAPDYPLGGLGYSKISLPTLSIQSVNANASGAILNVPGILGDGAILEPIVDRTGSVTTISILDGGEDYVSTPNVTLRVQDIVVSNLTIGTLPQQGDVVYQGSNINTATYVASVNSVSLLAPNEDPLLSLYNLRVFNYTSTPSTNQNLSVEDKNIFITLANTKYSDLYDDNGIKQYGDGAARATATFLNGLVVGEGKYLNTQGQPSSFSVLQDEVYNNYTYQITVQKEIAKYRDILLNLLHPSGTNLLGRYSMRTEVMANTHTKEAFYDGYTLSFYTGYVASRATMVTDFNNKSNNIVVFEDLLGANIGTFIFVNDQINIIEDNKPYVSSEVVAIDYANNSVELKSNTWLTFSNVAVVTGNANSATINITSVTDAYDIINNGNYSDKNYPLKDIVFAGDKILVDNNTSKIVESVNYESGIITLTSNLTQNTNSFMSVARTFSSSNVLIIGPVGFTYQPLLGTEDLREILTEDGRNILLG